jgi:protein-tyrosine phosphatase
MSDLIREVDIRKKELEDPIVIHCRCNNISLLVILILCSAGIGRTGTLLAILVNKEKALLGEEPDIMKTVLQLVFNSS